MRNYRVPDRNITKDSFGEPSKDGGWERLAETDFKGRLRGVPVSYSK